MRRRAPEPRGRPRAGPGAVVRELLDALLSQGLGVREIRCKAGAALATVIGKSGSTLREGGEATGPPAGNRGVREGGAEAVGPVSQETGQGALSIHEVLERVSPTCI